MARRWALGLVLGVGAAAGFPEAQQFRSGVDLVRLPVIVTGRDGAPVRGLTAADFEIREEGRVETITHFAEGAPGDAVPLHLGLLFDTSDSMGGDLREAAAAAVKFVDAVDEARDTTFVEFDTSVRTSRFEPPSYPMLFARIRSREAKGFTALYDALGTYLTSAIRRGGQHVLVMYTDGGDTRSGIDFGTLQRLLREADVLVYALGYMEHQPSSARMTQQSRLMQIARETGGEAYFPTSAADVTRFYGRIRDDLASRYTLGYGPSNPPPAGQFRKVSVRVVRPGLDARVRTRSGYVARR
jgi:Ca-activated chloride channel family protein